mmetsp:Transcript_48646/g.135958  ORF Transcript_48646/g.135958 Transcript_48646/m.135958 type:complete len:354 (+) Transcript_48646:34-1095(+)
MAVHVDARSFLLPGGTMAQDQPRLSQLTVSDDHAIKQDAEVVRDASREHEDVPNSMVGYAEGPTALDEKGHAASIEDATEDEQTGALWAEVCKHVADASEGAPAHGEVQRRLYQALLRACVERCDAHAHQRHGPKDQQKACGPDLIREENPEEGTIRACYEQVDRSVVEDAEDPHDRWPSRMEGVVESGGEVEDVQGQTVQDHCHFIVPWLVVHREAKEHRANDGEHATEAMGDSVKDLVQDLVPGEVHLHLPSLRRALDALTNVEAQPIVLQIHVTKAILRVAELFEELREVRSPDVAEMATFHAQRPQAFGAARRLHQCRHALGTRTLPGKVQRLHSAPWQAKDVRHQRCA